MTKAPWHFRAWAAGAGAFLAGGWANLCAAPPASGLPDARPLAEFFSSYCVECHGPDKQKAGRRFDTLRLPVADPDTLHDLQDAIDQLNLGEMPPADAPQPPAADTLATVERLTQFVASGHATLSSTGGRTVLRRMNRREYRNTIADLFGLNLTMFDPTSRFPRDETQHDFDNVGSVLKMSEHLLAQYLEAADQVVEKAFARSTAMPEQSWRFTSDFRQQPELRHSHGKVHNYSYLCLYETTHSDKHEGAYAPLLAFADGVPADGRYEIRVKAVAKHRRNPYDPALLGSDGAEPFRLGIVPGSARFGHLHLPQPFEPILGEVTLPDEEIGWHRFEVWLDRGFAPRFVFPNGLLNVRPLYMGLIRRYPDHFPEEDKRLVKDIVEARVVVMRHGRLPHIRIHEVEIRGPLPGSGPSPGFRTVLDGQPFASEQTRSLLHRFAERAYRRPVSTAEIDRLMQVVNARRAQGADAFTAFKDGLKAALCSPEFLYLVEPAADDAPAGAGRTLTAHALATRLSYFLWGTTPDRELRDLADRGTLLEPGHLRAQVRRLLADPRSDAFVAGFLDAWLNLRRLGDMPPDRGAFAAYYAHDLQAAMKTETRLFTRDLITRNASIAHFLDADYTFANRALARLYGQADAIAPEDGHRFRRLPLADRRRGGLLGQGSVLTVSANGIETSPVIRGVWVLENILGTPPPPPPDDVPAIDPDVRGARSIRDLLARHRDNVGCYECHRRIDPLGFALETFDPIGATRQTYERGLPIDTSGELPNGQSFRDLAELKGLLLKRKDQFARMLVERLLTYACGRSMEPLDRPQVDAILAATAADDYRLRDLIEEVVASRTFRSK